MRSSRSFLFAAALLLASSSAQAAILEFSTTLNGSSQVPPNASAATGSAFVFLNTSAQTLAVDISFTGLSAPASGAHIHCCAPAGSNAGVAIPFTAFPATTSGVYTNTFDLTAAATYETAFLTTNGGAPSSAEAALVTGLEDGLAYVNIHDVNFPGGEIRGQLAAIAPGPAPGAGLAGLIFAGALLGWRLSKREVEATG
ncbi:CHRD domain-containing protein [Methylocystis bryophila]|uniref:CHRD domain-containing protein n=1 Tax=Methylocystis bryophila TaxID=655015 RepID=A0A1W6N1K0_9HYPH|nr:CHRD domain-containing protein [Methylocystis bryophila]ARN83712.1 hypothetical protein B1812_16055 [Methylocystis bryophila]BDV38506.1 hypothetical protein DSM21852_17590 [Methylocystis bryophila]